MTYKTPVQEAGYNVGDKFICQASVSGSNGTFKVGEEITLNNDDGTVSPNFKNSKGVTLYVNLRNVEKVQTPAEKAGLVVGNKYVVKEDIGGGSFFKKGEVVEFRKDDGSNCPSFNYLTREPHQEVRRQPHWYIDLEKVEPYVEVVKTPAEELGLVFGRQYVYNGGGIGNSFKVGDIIELNKDDNTCEPQFKRVSDDYTQYVTITTVTEDTRTPAQKAGLVIGQRYLISSKSSSTAQGKVVFFTRDDGSDCPYFGNTVGAEEYCPRIENVLPAPVENTVIEFDKVLTQAQINAIKVLVG